MIRERRGKRGAGCLQVISVHYDPTIGPPRQRVVATLLLDAESLPSRITAELTATEQRNAKAYFVDRSNDLSEKRILESGGALVVQGHRIRAALADPGDLPLTALLRGNSTQDTPLITLLHNVRDLCDFTRDMAAGLHPPCKSTSVTERSPSTTSQPPRVNPPEASGAASPPHQLMPWRPPCTTTVTPSPS